MKVKIPANTLIAALSQVLKVTGSKQVSIKAEGDTLTVSGSDKGKLLLLNMPAAVKKEGSFTALPDAVIGVCRNRKDVILEMSDDESHVTVTSGSYSADITILPYEEITLEEPSGTELDLEEAELKVLLDVCERAQLSAPYIDGAPALPLHLLVNATGAHVASLDSFHVASVRTKQVTKDQDLELILPTGALTVINQASNGGKYRIILSDSVAYADNESFQLSLPVEQLDSGNLGLKHVKSMQKMIKDADEVTSARVDLEQLATILSNVYAVSEQGVPIVFTAKKGSLTVGTTTNYGSASETLDAEINGKAGVFQFNPALVSEVFSKIQGETIDINFLPKFMYLSIKNGETASLFIILRTA